MGQIVEMARPQLGTGAMKKTPTKSVAHSARLIKLPGTNHTCPACGCNAYWPACRRETVERGRWRIIAVVCVCGIKYEIREDLANGNARTKGRWGA